MEQDYVDSLKKQLEMMQKQVPNFQNRVNKYLMNLSELRFLLT